MVEETIQWEIHEQWWEPDVENRHAVTLLREAMISGNKFDVKFQVSMMYRDTTVSHVVPFRDVENLIAKKEIG